MNEQICTQHQVISKWVGYPPENYITFSHLKTVVSHRNLLFQGSIFRCENVSFREGKLRENQQNWLQLHHVDLILSTSPVFIDCSPYQHSMIGDIKGLHILFVLFMECQMWTLMVTVILMSYNFRSCSLCWVAIYYEWPPMPVNTLFFWVSWMAQQRKNFKISCLSRSCSYYSAPYFVNSFGMT